MVPQEGLLLQLLSLLDHLPLAPSAARRGRPCVYSEWLFVKALVVMIVRHLPTVHALQAVLEEPSMASVRAALSADERWPTQRTWERRLRAVPARLPEQIALVCAHVLALLDPWAEDGRAVAIDSTVLPARGGVWHKKDREAGVVPHTTIDTEAHWTKSGWHGWVYGWVYGWKLHLVITVGEIWLPLAAELTPATVADNEEAVLLLDASREGALFVLGDLSYQDVELAKQCAAHQRSWSRPGGGAIPTATTAWRCASSSISCARTPSRTSTASSRAFSIALALCPRKAWWPRSATSWARCWSTNWPSSIASRSAAACGQDSSRCCKLPKAKDDLGPSFA